jgi:hypothetical protein
MIEKLILTSRVTEIDAVSIRLIGAYKTTTLNTDPHLVLMFTALEDKSQLLTKSINQSNTESTLEDEDAIRDDKIRAMAYLLMGLVHHPSKKIKAAAQLVLTVFNKYGLTITGESYAIESSLINSLLNDLAAADLQEAIAAVPGCAEIIAELHTAQNNFEQTRIAYETDKAQESARASATALKKEVAAIINHKIVIYMRAMEVVVPDSHGVFAATIAQIIADNNEQVKKRRNKNNKPEEGED